MITYSIKDALIDKSKHSPGYVYVIRDEEVIFYVGKSQDPIHRLFQHLGIGDAWGRAAYTGEEFAQLLSVQSPILTTKTFFSSSIGTCIRENAPSSLLWSFDIYEKQDAVNVVIQAGLDQTFPRLVGLMQGGWYEQSTIIEAILIEEMKPFLNRLQNEHERLLPEKYRPKELLPDEDIQIGDRS